MNLYRVYPTPGRLDVSSDEGQAELRDWFAPEESMIVRWAIVSTPRGDIHDQQGTSSGLSNPVDRAVLRALRSHADAVITAASTVRVEAVPVPDSALLVILSRHGELDGHRVSPHSLRPGGVMIITGQDVTSNPEEHFPPGVATHRALDNNDQLNPVAIIDYLRGEGMSSLLLEAGSHLASAFLDQQLVDECILSLTGSPRSESHPPLPWWSEHWGQWSASAVFTDDARYLYTRYHRPHGGD